MRRGREGEQKNLGEKPKEQKKAPPRGEATPRRRGLGGGAGRPAICPTHQKPSRPYCVTRDSKQTVRWRGMGPRAPFFSVPFIFRATRNVLLHKTHLATREAANGDDHRSPAGCSACVRIVAKASRGAAQRVRV